MKNMILERAYDDHPATRILLTVTEDKNAYNVYVEVADSYGEEAKLALAAAIVKLADDSGVSPLSYLRDVGSTVAKSHLARKILGSGQSGHREAPAIPSNIIQIGG